MARSTLIWPTLGSEITEKFQLIRPHKEALKIPRL
ncbi:uncharacterized protein G2W53_014155 [Senna tora]|uniref:Uncharacterized protein n=1 Tax=Senna tora TaxID=362788 RepID=A0A834WSZ6_9FABA|nr:uncharacterized protein G2W53_014155 [Senna tora]